MFCKKEKTTAEIYANFMLIISFSHAVYAAYMGGGV